MAVFYRIWFLVHVYLRVCVCLRMCVYVVASLLPSCSSRPPPVAARCCPLSYAAPDPLPLRRTVHHISLIIRLRPGVGVEGLLDIGPSAGGVAVDRTVLGLSARRQLSGRRGADTVLCVHVDKGVAARRDHLLLLGLVAHGAAQQRGHGLKRHGLQTRVRGGATPHTRSGVSCCKNPPSSAPTSQSSPFATVIYSYTSPRPGCHALIRPMSLNLHQRQICEACRRTAPLGLR
jgi:hypothetical protein